MPTHATGFCHGHCFALVYLNASGGANRHPGVTLHHFDSRGCELTPTMLPPEELPNAIKVLEEAMVYLSQVNH